MRTRQEIEETSQNLRLHLNDPHTFIVGYRWINENDCCLIVYYNKRNIIKWIDQFDDFHVVWKYTGQMRPAGE